MDTYQQFECEIRSRKKVALGYCLPDECRGIWDHIRNSFTVTHFAIGKSPERPNGEWIQVNANEEIAVKTNSAFVVCDRVNIKVDRTQIQFGIRRLDD